MCQQFLNPAPASEINEDIFPLIDYFTPNETEAGFYVNHKVENEDDAKKASQQLLQRGIKNVIITLGDKGAYFANNEESFLCQRNEFKRKSCRYYGGRRCL